MTPRSPLHNYMISLAGLGVGKVVRVSYVAICIHALGQGGWGIMAFAFAALAYPLLLADAGRTSLATLLPPRSPRLDTRLGRSLIMERLQWGIPLYAILWIIIAWTKPLGGSALQIYGLVLLVRPLQPDWLYYRREASGSWNVQQTLRASALLLFVVLYKGTLTPELVASLEVGTECFTALVGWFLLPGSKRGLLRFPGRGRSWALLRQSTPLLLIALLSTLHLNGDVMVLRFTTNVSELGIYDASYKLVTFFLLGVTAFSQAFRPALVRQIKLGIYHTLTTRIAAMQRTLSVVALLFVAGVGAISDLIYHRLLPGQELRAQQLLMVLSFYVVFTFAAIPLAEWFLITHSRKRFIAMIAVAGITNIALNTFWTLRYGISAAPWVTLVIEGGVLCYLFSQYRGKFPGELQLGRGFWHSALWSIALVSAFALGAPRALYFAALAGIPLSALALRTVGRSEWKTLTE